MVRGIPTLFRSKKYAALTLSGNEITDASRRLGLAGDGLLNDSSYGIWPAATNLCTNGGFETNTTGWVTWGAGVAIERRTTGAKFGSACLHVTVDDFGSRGARNGTTLAASTVYTVSVWCNLPTGKTVRLAVYNPIISLELGGADHSGSGSWSRVSCTFTSDAGGGDHKFFVMTYGDNDAVEWDIDGFQIETGSIATPYIETDGGTASRSAGRVRAPASLLNATKGAMMLRWRSPRVTPQTTGFGRMLEWGTYQAQALYLGLSGSGAGNVPLMFTRHTTIPAGHSTIPNVGAELAAGAVYTIGAQWDEAGYNIVFNGVKYGVTADTLIPVLTDTTIDIGGDGTATNAGGDYLWAAFYDDKSATLSAGDVTTIHAFGNADKSLRDFPGNPSGFWDGKTGFMEVRS